jgi:proteasome lid subunit RPN8/RPN11
MTKDQSKPDVRQLSQRNLPESKFPAKADRFRVFLDPSAHDTIQKHANRNLAVEIGGVLVGGWEKDADGPFVVVRNVICSELAASGAGELTFTHDAWAEIHKVMDADHPDANIVGWYHTHPDFGIFLSERDQFIHEHFFGDPGQIAYVIDPIRGQEGVFVWRGGKTALCQHYWIGDEIRTSPEKREDRRGRGQSKAKDDPGPVMVRSEPMRSDWLLLSLLGILFFLVGYLLADRMGAWERSRLVDGVVAHFATMRILRPGLKENLDIVAQEMERLRGGLATIRPKEANGTATLSQAELDQWSQRLRETQAALEQIEAVYCFNELESAAVAKLLGEEFARLRGGLGQRAPSGEPTSSKPGRQSSAEPPVSSPSPGPGPAPPASRTLSESSPEPTPSEPKAKGSD